MTTSNPEPLGETLEPIEGQTDALEMLQEDDMPEYLQATSIQGYKVHAVPSAAERTGIHSSFVWVGPICGTIKGRTVGLMPNMRIGATPKPFSRDIDDFRDPSQICKACMKEIMRREGE